jgi:SAM-dependent methyltransferase
MNKVTVNHKLNPSESYYRNDQLNLDCWFQVAQIDYEELIKAYSFNSLFQSFNQEKINLLDIGCGTAKFPSFLDQDISSHVHVSVDLLDLSEYCLEIAQKQYDSLKHFEVARSYLSAFETFYQTSDSSRTYDLIWAIHSLCTVEKSKVKAIHLHFLSLLKANGIYLIYQLSEDSKYYQLNDFYRQHYPQSDNTIPFITSEDHQQILDSLGISYEIVRLSFSHKIDGECKDLLETYLKKCILNENLDTISFFQPLLKEYFGPPE